MQDDNDEIKRRQKIWDLKRQKIRSRAAALNSCMMRVAEQHPLGGDRDVLQSQAALLDAAFRNFIAVAADSSKPDQYYALALKAQNQFRQTALALKTLKNKETDDRKK